jgi:hypothetical protein
MAGFFFRLEHEDGTPADPPTLHTAVPNWQAGDTIPLGRDKTLRVIDVRDDSDGGGVSSSSAHLEACETRFFCPATLSRKGQ